MKNRKNMEEISKTIKENNKRKPTKEQIDSLFDTLEARGLIELVEEIKRDHPDLPDIVREVIYQSEMGLLHNSKIGDLTKTYLGGGASKNAKFDCVNLTTLSKDIYSYNKSVGWWTDSDLELMGKDRVTLVASKLALIHSEVSEALEGLRKGLNDDHLPERPMIEVELADAIIRILDLSGFMGLDIQGAMVEKFEYNKSRSDHKLENRNKEGGKTI